MRGDELCGGCQRIPLIRPDLADRTSRVVDQQKKESLFFGKKNDKAWPAVGSGGASLAS